MKRWAGAWAISRQVGYPGAQLWRGLFPPNRPPSNRAKSSAEGQVLMASVQVGASGTQSWGRGVKPGPSSSKCIGVKCLDEENIAPDSLTCNSEHRPLQISEN